MTMSLYLAHTHLIEAAVWLAGVDSDEMDSG
ncbi:hypothetical protein SMF913_11558 [Streptomyces malaysiensis]|uniref:Uncharacterized protein n=1 Tax=Streptomyces malaysiensis TaxID=92644 RepID=A0A2J7Z5I5_STRMQ|nr:hypothetical protein SMF913_11558 [Streptomyces malaysiensis]